MTEQVPKELAALFEAERTSPIGDLASPTAVRAKVAATVGHAPLGGALGGAGKVIAILAVVVGAGSIAYLIGRDEPRRPRSSTVVAHEPVAPTPEAAAQVAPPPVAVAPMGETHPSSEPPAPVAVAPIRETHPSSELPAPVAVAPMGETHPSSDPPPRRTTAPMGETHPSSEPPPRRTNAPMGETHPSREPPPRRTTAPMRRERDESAATPPPTPVARRSNAVPEPSQAELVREAWASIATGEPTRALELAKRDRELHPGGALAEEREALAVQALANLFQYDEARDAATRFLAQHPHSIHRARIERVLQSLPTSEAP